MTSQPGWDTHGLRHGVKQKDYFWSSVREKRAKREAGTPDTTLAGSFCCKLSLYPFNTPKKRPGGISKQGVPPSGSSSPSPPGCPGSPSARTSMDECPSAHLHTDGSRTNETSSRSPSACADAGVDTGTVTAKLKSYPGKEENDFTFTGCKKINLCLRQVSGEFPKRFPTREFIFRTENQELSYTPTCA